MNEKDKLGLINDIYALSLAKYYKMNTIMEYAKYFTNEDNFEVLAAIVGCLGGMRSKLRIGSHNYKLLTSLILALVQRKIDPTVIYEDINENSFASVVVKIKVLNGDAETIDLLLNTDVAPSFRSSKFIAVAKKRGMTVYEEFIDLYNSSPIPDERSAAVSALGHCGPEAIDKLLKDITARIKLQDSIYVYHGLMSNHRLRAEVIIHIIKNWDLILTKFVDNYEMLEGIIESIFAQTNSETIVTVEAFLKKIDIAEMEMGVNRMIEQLEVIKQFLIFNCEE